MSALDRLIPEPRRLEIDSVDVTATPDRAWEAIRYGELGRSPLTRALFDLRTLPDRLRGEPPASTSLRIDDLDAMDGAGFHVLAEEPGREVVLGAIGKVWKLEIPFADARTAEAFAAWSEPGWVRVAWALRVTPRDEGARITLELRVDATDDRSWRRFSRYFRVIGPASRYIRRDTLRAVARDLGTEGADEPPRDDWRDVLHGIGGAAAMAFDLLTPFLRGARSHWGVDEATARRPHPGDELIPEPRWSWTHGIEIDAPPEQVWPWVAQIGATRGGFYSYQWLENLAGCELSNADAIHPEWQVELGDDLYVHPKMPPLRVVAMGPGRWFVAHGAPDEAARERGESWVAGSWLFLVEPLGDGRSRFISRYRAACSDDLATRLSYGPTLVEPVGFVMDRGMLRGVRERAERREGEALAS